ncbi:MAG: molybdopterin-dependent oxidoreductase [Deltaproteobacteria bacterium]|nr:molybdopterin-dependent oxidoreductase [Deltaproteobacteria bacterium]
MDITRREFIKTVSLLGGAVIIGGCELFSPREEIPPYIYGGGFADPIETVTGIDTIYSVCAMCEGNCGIRARIKDGWLVKIDGNPYHPNSREPHLPFQTDSKEAIKVAGSTCVKGQSGIQTLYNPYRVKEPLKRVGPRGSGIWKAISWEQAVGEIVNGGDLFGEGTFEGLRQIRDVHRPLDKSRPEFGPGANRLILLSGRIDLGAKTFLNRFMNAYGSVNRIYGDETLWDSSRRTGFQLTFDQDHDDLQPDVLNCRYLISFGSSPLESGNPMQSVARKLMKARFGPLGGIESIQDKGYRKTYKGRYGQLKWVAVDPRMSESASKAHQWIPIKPGTYAALALGMIRRIIEKAQYNRAFLENTSAKAAQRDGEEVWTDAAYLVRLDTMTFIKADEAGLAGKSSKFLVFDGERVVPFDSVDHGVLEADVRLNGIRCKSVFSLLKERAYEKTLEQYGQICGVGPDDIKKIADEFAENGRRAVAELGEGGASHVNGTYTARTINILNLLVGNVNRKGGLIVGGNWEVTKKKRLLFEMEHVENGPHLAGLRIDRAGVAY